MTAASVTQTWRVGPRSEVTQVMSAPRISLMKRQKGKRGPTLELGSGVHSLWIDDEGNLQNREGKQAGAWLEIEVNVAGAFAFGLEGASYFRVNGREVRRSRLRANDEIEFGDILLSIASMTHDSKDRTMVVNPRAGSLPRKHVIQSLPTWKVIAVFSTLLIVAAAGVFGFLLFGWQSEERARPEQPPKRIEPAQMPALISEEPAPAPFAREEKKVFEKKDFEEVLLVYRRGDVGQACQAMKEAKAARAGRWREKALLFVERRCS